MVHFIFHEYNYDCVFRQNTAFTYKVNKKIQLDANLTIASELIWRHVHAGLYECMEMKGVWSETRGK